MPFKGSNEKTGVLRQVSIAKQRIFRVVGLRRVVGHELGAEGLKHLAP